MQISGMLYGAQLLKYVDFPTSEVLGPGASEDEIQDLIDRHRQIFIKPIFKGGIGKKGKAGLIGKAADLKKAFSEKERLYFAELRHGSLVAKANGVTFEAGVPAQHEVYFAITDSTEFRAPTLTLTHVGGIDIEELRKDQIAQVPFDALTGLKAFVVANALTDIGAPKELISPLVQYLPKLWELMHHYGMTTLELNPIRMRLSKDGRLTPVACDFKCGFDRDDPRWVFNNVREGLDAGMRFNTGVVYLPPSGVRDGVVELTRVNPDLEKIVIITEKISVHDAREIRALGQGSGVDIFGANCLGMADSWNRVRIGGALGGNNPEEVLLKGSIAIFSNSGGFTSTIAQYLGTEGWGTTTLVSSGKDVYIHYAARDFAHAFKNDDRSKAAVLYAEPGGYYEQGVEFGKPVVACIVGRWKSKLTRAVGHAGAMAGAGDRAEDKERWFMERFGVGGLFTPEQQIASAKGAVVTNIAHIPAALTAVMNLNGISSDFAPRGNLALKPWMANDQGLKLPPDLALASVEAISPYNVQIAALAEQIGAVMPRQGKKDRSGATVMDPTTQVTSVHGYSVLDLALEPLEANFALPLVHEIATANDRAMLDIAVAAEMNLVGDPVIAAADAARDAGNSPNTVMATAAAIVGPRRVERALACSKTLIDLFAHTGLQDGHDEDFDFSAIVLASDKRQLFLASSEE